MHTDWSWGLPTVLSSIRATLNLAWRPKANSHTEQKIGPRTTTCQFPQSPARPNYSHQQSHISRPPAAFCVERRSSFDRIVCADADQSSAPNIRAAVQSKCLLKKKRGLYSSPWLNTAASSSPAASPPTSPSLHVAHFSPLCVGKYGALQSVQREITTLPR